MKALFKEIWNERPHRCAVCGYPIYEAKAHNFSHIRSKGARPDLKMDKDNIEILCSTLDRQDKEIGCHNAVHEKPSIYRERKNNGK
ncbi:MAG: hypothetical protein RIE52_12105 [Balneola sp.]